MYNKKLKAKFDQLIDDNNGRYQADLINFALLDASDSSELMALAKGPLKSHRLIIYVYKDKIMIHRIKDFSGNGSYVRIFKLEANHELKGHIDWMMKE